MTSIRLLLAFVVVLLARTATTAPLQSAPAQSTTPRMPRRTPPAAKPGENTKPMSLSDIVSYLEKARQEKRIVGVTFINTIEGRKLDFPATQENLDQVKAAGATDRVLEAIKRVAQTPTVAPVVPSRKTPAREGSLELTCAPGDCQVTIKGQFVTIAAGGKFTRPNLPEGDVTIQFMKDGYVPQEKHATIVADRPAKVSAELKPAPETFAAWGKQLYERTLSALGGTAGLQETKTFFAKGTATIWGRDGRQNIWPIVILMRPSERAFMRVLSGKSFYEIEFLPSPQPTTKLGDQEARDINTELQLVREYLLPNFFDRLGAAKMNFVADRLIPAENEDAVFRAESATAVFRMTLDGDGRPKLIREESPVGQKVEARYSSYKQQGKGWFPYEMSIVLPGTPRQGIDVRFDLVEPNPGKARDAEVKKRK